MKEIILNMNEKNKYEIIKKLVETNGNKLRAATKLNVTKRTINRLILKYKERGKSAFQHGNHGKKPSTATDPSLSNIIIQLYSSKYQGFNYMHYKEMLEENEGIKISYTALRNILLKNKLLSPKIRKRTKKEMKRIEILMRKESKSKTSTDIERIVSHELSLEDAHPRQEKPKYFGEVVEMDGSIHKWFGDKKTTLHLAIDKCSNTVLGGYFDHQETLRGYYNVFKQILITYGIPSQFNTDNRTVFNYEKLNESKRTNDKDVLTQFGYACKSLGVSIKTSSVPQSKGLIERTNGTFQDRFINELRLKGITTIDEANLFLQEVFIPRFNERFSLDYTKFDSVMETKPTLETINKTLAVITPRVVDNGSSIKYKNNYYKMYINDKLTCFKGGTKCLVVNTFNDELIVTVDDIVYDLRIAEKHKKTSDFDELNTTEVKTEKKPYSPKMCHPWKLASFLAYQEKVKKTRKYI